MNLKSKILTIDEYSQLGTTFHRDEIDGKGDEFVSFTQEEWHLIHDNIRYLQVFREENRRLKSIVSQVLKVIGENK